MTARRGLTAAVLVPAGMVLAVARGSHFTWDDYPNFVHALEEGLTWSYLTAQATTLEFLAPAHRLVNWLFERVAPLRFGMALSVLLACLALAALLLHRVLARLAGGAWWPAVPTAAFGASIVMLTAVQWWTAGLHSLPSTVLSLAAVRWWLRWRDTGRRAWLAAAAIAIAAASLFYVKAILVPLYLLLLRVLALERLPVRAVPRTLLAERGQWALLTLPVVLYLAAFAGLGYGGSGMPPELATLPAYLAGAWVRGLLPALANVRVTATGTGAGVEAAIVLLQTAFLASVVWTVRRDRGAWRGWAFAAVALTANLLFHGFYRLGQVGPGVLAHELRYYVEPAYLLAIGVTLALAPPGGPVAKAPSRRALVCVGAGLALHAALFAWSAAGIAAAWPGYEARGWATTLRGEVEHARTEGGPPAVLDAVVPEYVVPSWMGRYAFVSQVLRTFAPDVRTNASSGPLHVVAGDGSLWPAQVRQVVDVTAPLSGPSVEVTDATRSPADPRCVRTGAGPGVLEYRPDLPLFGQRLGLRAVVRTTPAADLPLAVDRGLGYADPADMVLGADVRDGGTLLDLVTPGLAALRLDLPPATRVCIDALEIVDVRTAT